MTQSTKTIWKQVADQTNVAIWRDEFKPTDMLGNPEVLHGFGDNQPYIVALSHRPVRTFPDSLQNSSLIAYGYNRYDGDDHLTLRISAFSPHPDEPVGSFKGVINYTPPDDVYQSVITQLLAIHQEQVALNQPFGGLVWMTLLLVEILPKGEDHV